MPSMRAIGFEIVTMIASTHLCYEQNSFKCVVNITTCVVSPKCMHPVQLRLVVLWPYYLCYLSYVDYLTIFIRANWLALGLSYDTLPISCNNKSHTTRSLCIYVAFTARYVITISASGWLRSETSTTFWQDLLFTSNSLPNANGALICVPRQTSTLTASILQ